MFTMIERWQVLKADIQMQRFNSQAQQDVELIVVSKKQSVETIRALAQAGQKHFGESYCQEALPKIQALRDLDLTWHFIGPLQSNKIKKIVEHFDWIHSVDRLDCIQLLQAACVQYDKVLNVFIQVNISHESQKSGVMPQQLNALLEKLQACTHLSFQGLMGMGPLSTETALIEQAFSELAQLKKKLEQQHIACPHLSLGMSKDYTRAIAYGSTWLRIGSNIFTGD